MLKRLKVVAIDLDGVIYHGSRLIPGADEAVARLRGMGLRVVFLTNNSAARRERIARKLSDLGIPAEAGDVLNSAYATGLLLGRLAQGRDTTAVVLGSDDLKGIVTEAGITVVDSPPADYLVVGMDHAFSYERIAMGLEAVLGGALFVACNRDLTYPAEGGRLKPGAGAMVAAMEAVCARAPDYFVGKPGTMMLELLAAAEAAGPDEILMVGDTYTSDIVMAKRFGSPSVLVCSDQVAECPVDEGEPLLTISSLAELPGVLGDALGKDSGGS